ncbi:MAG: hypothetical protein DI564_02650 [Rhodanobacter denitrificans]|uniref:DUF2269 family protein n=1 Tax=Rhodanobacter denitrificans TaxID=666685 RepID=A0A2W5KMK3_9GAMM|nr:MAG: hypothetical protein DI564_02650 [Rhodanobacter denitrificans]
MDFLAAVHFVLALPLLAVALAVRFAGSARILNSVDYARVDDVAALHRWAGNRLLLLPTEGLAAGLVSLRYPSLAFPLLFASILWLIAVAIWVTVGSDRFFRPYGAARPQRGPAASQPWR